MQQQLNSVGAPDSKIHGANMGPTWGRQDSGGPHDGPMNFVIWARAYIWGRINVEIVSPGKGLLS